MTFWNFTFLGKHFLTSSYEFSIHFIYRNDKNLIFQLWKYKTCLITTQSKWEIMFTLIHFDMGICFYLYELKISKFQNFIYNIYKKLWGDDIINSLIWIFIRTGQEMFSKKIWNFKMSYLPYFSSNFHNFFHCSVGKNVLFLFKLN